MPNYQVPAPNEVINQKGVYLEPKRSRLMFWQPLHESCLTPIFLFISADTAISSLRPSPSHSIHSFPGFRPLLAEVPRSGLDAFRHHFAVPAGVPQPHVGVHLLRQALLDTVKN